MSTDDTHTFPQLSKARIELYSSLGSLKIRRKHGLFTVEGSKSIRDLIDFFHPEAYIIGSDESVDFNGIRKDLIFQLKERDLKRISNFQSTPDAIAVFRIPREDTGLHVDANNLYVVLDGIQDPGNLGTIIRTCHWFGIDRIFASHDTVDQFNPKVVQASMGSLGHVGVTYCDLWELMKLNPSMHKYGTLLNGRDIYDAHLHNSGFIVFGNEGKGISSNIRDAITDPLLIPPFHDSNHSESLNVSVALGITLSEFRSRLY